MLEPQWTGDFYVPPFLSLFKWSDLLLLSRAYSTTLYVKRGHSESVLGFLDQEKPYLGLYRDYKILDFKLVSWLDKIWGVLGLWMSVSNIYTSATICFWKRKSALRRSSPEWHFILFYFVVVGIKSRVLCMLGKCVTNWAIPLALFLCSICSKLYFHAPWLLGRQHDDFGWWYISPNIALKCAYVAGLPEWSALPRRLLSFLLEMQNKHVCISLEFNLLQGPDIAGQGELRTAHPQKHEK